MADKTFDNLIVNNTLGIGTTEPAAQLHIAATEGISSKVFLESINGGLLKVTAEPNSVSLGTENAFPLSINTNGLPRIQISSEGNVGIGTIPKQIFAGNDSSRVATPLTIKATGVSQGLITFEDASGTPTWHINQKLGGTISGLNFAETKVADGRLFIAAGGNVGIGTASPVTRLQVNGSIYGQKILNPHTAKDILGGKKGTFLGTWEEIRGQITQGNINSATTKSIGASIEWSLDSDDQWGINSQSDIQLIVGGWWYPSDMGSFTAKLQYYNSNTGVWVDGCQFSGSGLYNCPNSIPWNNPPYVTKVRLYIDSISSYFRIGYIQLWSAYNPYGWIKNLEAAKNIHAENIYMAGGAYCTGTKWEDASSIDYKQDVAPLTLDKALETLVDLNPVTFRYKVEEDKKHVGFIAEEVPELVASKDRKGLSPMDIIGVLTKVVQHQQKEIEELKARLNEGL